MTGVGNAASEALDLLLHPVRVRIVQMLCGDRQLTPQQLARGLPEVPQASLYRHLSALVDGGAVEVVQERRVGNMTERVYALTGRHLSIGPEQAKEMPREDVAQMFTAFGALMLGELRRYLDRDGSGAVNLVADGVAVWQQVAYLDVEALHRFSADLYRRLEQSQTESGEAGRQRQYVYFVSVPAADEPHVDLDRDLDKPDSPRQHSRQQGNEDS